jgi:hypothetical protein
MGLNRIGLDRIGLGLDWIRMVDELNVNKLLQKPSFWLKFRRLFEC